MQYEVSQRGEIMVYVVQEDPGKNLLPARMFGNLKTLLPRGREVGLQSDTSHVLDLLRSGLQDFTVDDHLLLVGDPILIGLAFHVAASKVHTITTLKWDRQESEYYPVSISLESRTTR